MPIRPKARRQPRLGAARTTKPPAPDLLKRQRNGIGSLREPVKALSDEQARRLALNCRDAALDKKAENVVVLDIRSRAGFADFFVIATGRSLIQARAVADGVVESTEAKVGAPTRTEGYADGNWILIDYGPVIVHVFTPQAREFYNLERLWGKAAGAAKKR